MRYAYGNKYGVTHGLSDTRIYKIWSNMKSRCYNPNAERYERYGGRGITVCDKWREDFLSFYQWAMSNGYESGLSLERKDIDQGYSPENCCWITKGEQSLNTCRSHYVTHGGETKCVEHWCKELGLHSNTIYHRAKLLHGDFHAAIFEYTAPTKNSKKFCAHGHEYTPENSGYTSQGYRYCKICKELAKDKRNAAKRENRRRKKECQKQ